MGGGGCRLPEDDERRLRGGGEINIDDVITKNTRIQAATKNVLTLLIPSLQSIVFYEKCKYFFCSHSRIFTFYKYDLTLLKDISTT